MWSASRTSHEDAEEEGAAASPPGQVDQADLDCDPYLYLAGRRSSRSSMSGVMGMVLASALLSFGGNQVAPDGRRHSTRQYGGAAPQVARHLSINNHLEYHADTKAPIFACFTGTRAMQTVLAKLETAIVTSTVCMFTFSLGLSGLLLKLRIVSSDEYGCPVPIDWLHNYWFWLNLRTVVSSAGTVCGCVYWHLVRRRPGCTYRRWFVGFGSFTGLMFCCVAVFGSVLVGMEAKEDSLDPEYCIDMHDKNFNESIPGLAGDFIAGVGFLYAFFWQGAVSRNEPRAFLVVMGTTTAGFLLTAINSLAEGSLLSGSFQAMVAVLLGAFTISLPIRRHRMRRRLAEILSQDKDAYIAAWSEHASDVGTIERLVALCAGLPRTKPRQTCTDLLAKVDEESGTIGRKRLGSKDVRRRGCDSTGRVTDRFELYRRAYVFYRPFETCLQRVLVIGGSQTSGFHMGPVKAPERVYLKLIRSYNGDCSLVCDMIRCSAIYDTLRELLEGLQRLKADPDIEILQVKNRFDPAFDVTQLGYRDLKMLVTLPGVTHGYVAEVQLHLRSIISVKSAEGHKAYVHVRDSLGN